MLRGEIWVFVVYFWKNQGVNMLWSTGGQCCTVFRDGRTRGVSVDWCHWCSSGVAVWGYMGQDGQKHKAQMCCCSEDVCFWHTEAEKHAALIVIHSFAYTTLRKLNFNYLFDVFEQREKPCTMSFSQQRSFWLWFWRLMDFSNNYHK